MACLIRRLYVLTTMFFFTRPRFISTQITAQATANLRSHLSSTQHPTTNVHQVYTALLSDSTVSRAQDTEESATAQPLLTTLHYQPAILAAVTNDPTSNATEATRNQISSPETLNVASENTSTGNQQQITTQSQKSSSEQPAHMISQTSFSGYTSSAAVILQAPYPTTKVASVISSLEEQKAIPSSTAEVQVISLPNVYSTTQYQPTNVVYRNSYTEKSLTSAVRSLTPSSSTSAGDKGNDLAAIITTTSSTLTAIYRTDEQQTTTEALTQIQVELSQIFWSQTIYRVPEASTT
ncbi:mucin-5AC-like, partial [Stylophora pistillata]|uniref:mucin-5AC-like n=1 Tax=Stylophora pistillata TaxID=50429 RepID=UPI000C044A28